MKALLLVAHGSRRDTSNDEVRKLTERLRIRASDQFGQVECAFLELAQPSIPEGIRKCALEGAGEVVIVPYFLSAGRHVLEDIPAEVAIGRQQNPELDIRVTAHLGAAEDIGGLLAGLAVDDG